MKKLTFDIPKVETTAKNEWGEIVGMFLDRLNPGRVAAGYKELTSAALGAQLVKAGYKDTNAIRDLYKKCNGAKSFSKYFSALVKIRGKNPINEKEICNHIP